MFYTPGKYAITTIQNLNQKDQDLITDKANWSRTTFGTDYIILDEKGFFWIWGTQDQIKRFDIKEVKHSFVDSLIIVPIELVKQPYKGIEFTMSSWFEIQMIGEEIKFGHIFIKDVTPIEIGF